LECLLAANTELHREIRDTQEAQQASGKRKSRPRPRGASKQTTTAAAELTPVQQTMADLLADIVAHGGREDVVDGLVLAVARHGAHRRLDHHLSDDESKVVGIEVAKLAARDSARWKSELATAWPVHASW
jgi:hypothetical protein